MATLISVIMPVYNQEKYLAEAIESVLAQTHKIFEFIVYDDGSTDHSADIIKYYAKSDNRIVAVFGDNMGRSAATNKIAALAKGVWIALLDADDVMLSNRLERQLAFNLENPDIDVLSCYCNYIDSNGKFQGVQRPPFVSILNSVEQCRTVLSRNEIVLCAFTGIMIKKEVYFTIGGLRSQFWPCDDLEFFNRIIEKQYVLVIMQEVLMDYRIHASSAMASSQWRMFQMTRYTDYCINLRRAGQSEISFPDFEAIRGKDPWWVRLNDKRYYFHILFHKKAKMALSSKNFADFSWLILLTSILYPKFVYRAIVKKANEFKVS